MKACAVTIMLVMGMAVCPNTPPPPPPPFSLPQELWFIVCLVTEESSHVLPTAQRRGFVAQMGVALLHLALMMPLCCCGDGVENKMVC